MDPNDFIHPYFKDSKAAIFSQLLENSDLPENGTNPLSGVGLPVEGDFSDLFPNDFSNNMFLPNQGLESLLEPLPSPSVALNSMAEVLNPAQAPVLQPINSITGNDEVLPSVYPDPDIAHAPILPYPNQGMGSLFNNSLGIFQPHRPQESLVQGQGLNTLGGHFTKDPFQSKVPVSTTLATSSIVQNWDQSQFPLPSQFFQAMGSNHQVVPQPRHISTGAQQHDFQDITEAQTTKEPVKGSLVHTSHDIAPKSPPRKRKARAKVSSKRVDKQAKNPSANPENIYGRPPIAHDWYGQSSDGRTSYVFKYNSRTNLNHEAKFFTKDQLRFYLDNCPRDPVLRIQCAPAQSKHRMTKEESECLWRDCPVKSNRIVQPFHRVAFDEFDTLTSHGKKDPFLVAGSMHLWCFEQCFDLVEFHGRVVGEERRFPREQKNAMSLAKHTDRDIVEVVLEQWFKNWRGSTKKPYVPLTHPRNHEDSLGYALTMYHVQEQVEVRQRKRDERNEKRLGRLLNTIEVHKGDLGFWARRQRERQGLGFKTSAELVEAARNYRSPSPTPYLDAMGSGPNPYLEESTINAAFATPQSIPTPKDVIICDPLSRKRQRSADGAGEGFLVSKPRRLSVNKGKRRISQDRDSLFGDSPLPLEQKDSSVDNIDGPWSEAAFSLIENPLSPQRKDSLKERSKRKDSIPGDDVTSPERRPSSNVNGKRKRSFDSLFEEDAPSPQRRRSSRIKGERRLSDLDEDEFQARLEEMLSHQRKRSAQTPTSAVRRNPRRNSRGEGR